MCRQTAAIDLFGTVNTFEDGPAPNVHINPRLNVDKANWQAFQNALAQSPRRNAPSQTAYVDVLEARLVSALQTICKRYVRLGAPLSRDVSETRDGLGLVGERGLSLLVYC